MEGYSHFPIIELVPPNPENHHDVNDHDNVGNPMSEEDASSLTRQPRQNQSSLNNMGSDENTNPLEVQLQSLRIDSVGEGLFHGNSTNQQALTGNLRIEPSHPYEGELYGNITNQQILAAENSGIRLSQSYKRQLHENNIINQQIQAARNFGIGLSHDYDMLLSDRSYPNQQILVENPRIGPGHIHNSSSLMRQRYNNITSLEVVRGRVVLMSKEEDGSEFLVRVLDGKNPGDIKFILMEVLDHLHDLMMDWFGKRVIEKIFDVLNVAQVTSLFEEITRNMFEFLIVCENNIGCRVIQNMIDHFSKERQIMIIFTYALKEIVVPMATSQNGSYVLQNFLKLCSPASSKVILDAMALECAHIATDKTGCSVLQKCLFTAKLESSCGLICAVTRRVLLLAPHQYGNYVVQYVIKFSLHEILEEIVNRLRYSYVGLSMNKHGSNVVEELLRVSNQKNVGIIVQEIMCSPRFLELVRNDYGNYVAQTALECSQGVVYDMLVLKISQHFNNLITNAYGRKVIEFMNGGGRRYRTHNFE